MEIPSNPHLEELIVVQEPRGRGKPMDPCRIVIVVYRKNGERIAEYDPLAPTYAVRPNFDGFWVVEHDCWIAVKEGVTFDRVLP